MPCQRRRRRRPGGPSAGGIRAGEGADTLVIAPTGSGKTLAAFLWAIDRLAASPPPADKKRRCRVLYVSPLKALAVDIERNLRSPLTGIRQAARRLGLPEPEIAVAVRTGDTAADERRKIAAHPPDILITTPESLFLLLTSQARETLRGVETVIVDEVHAVAGTKRGAHLALSLERLDALRGAGRRAGAAGRAVGDRAAGGRGRDVPRRGAAGDRGAAGQRQADGTRGHRAGRGHQRAGERGRGPTARTTRRGGGRSGRTSRSGCST